MGRLAEHGNVTTRGSAESKTTADTAMVRDELRGLDLNQRPPGYGPDELPLLYPAAGLYSIRNSKSRKGILMLFRFFNYMKSRYRKAIVPHRFVIDI